MSDPRTDEPAEPLDWETLAARLEAQLADDEEDTVDDGEPPAPSEAVRVLAARGLHAPHPRPAREAR